MISSFFWDLYAFCYDSIATLIPYKEMLNDVMIALDIKKGDRILNCGCGTGNLEKKIDTRTNKWVEIESVDISKPMLERAIKKNSRSSIPINFQIASMDEKFPFPECSFDKIICMNSLYAVKNPESTFSEFRRLLRRGGKIIIVNPIGKANIFKIFRNHLQKIRKFSDMIETILTFPMLLIVMVFNLIVLRLDGSARFYCPNEKKMSDLEKRFSFMLKRTSQTYAGQDFLFELEG